MLIVFLIVVLPICSIVLFAIGERLDAKDGFVGEFPMDNGDGSYWREYKEKYPTFLDTMKKHLRF